MKRNSVQAIFPRESMFQKHTNLSIFVILVVLFLSNRPAGSSYSKFRTSLILRDENNLRIWKSPPHLNIAVAVWVKAKQMIYLFHSLLKGNQLCCLISLWSWIFLSVTKQEDMWNPIMSKYFSRIYPKIKYCRNLLSGTSKV